MNLPDGTYRAVAAPIETDAGTTYAQFGLSGQKGTRQVVVNFEVLDGEHAGARIAWFGYFTDKTAAKTIEALRTCGFKGDDLAAARTQELTQEVSIVVAGEEYNGKITSKVQWVNRPGGAGFRLAEPMKDGDFRAFAAQMKSTVVGVPEVGGGKAVKGARSPDDMDQSRPPQDDEPPPHSDDHIPW